MSEQTNHADSSAYSQNNRINRKINIPEKRNCIAVPEVKIIKTTNHQLLKSSVKKDGKGDINKKIEKIILEIAKGISSVHLKNKRILSHYMKYINQIPNIIHLSYLKKIITRFKLNDLLYKNMNYLNNFKSVKNLKDLLQSSKRCQYFIGTTAAAVLMLGIIASANYRIGIEVFVEDQLVGVVHNKREYNQYLKEVVDELSDYVGTEVEIDKEPELVSKIVNVKTFVSPDDFKKRLKSVFDESIGAYAILADGKMITAVPDESTAKTVLEELKKPYISSNDDIKVEFDKNIEIKKMAVKVGDIQNAEGALAALTASEEEVKVYTVRPKDTLWNIARNHDMMVDDILAINPGLTDAIQPGQQINLNVPKPVVGVKTRQIVAFNEEIPYGVNKIEDSNLFKGRQSIVEEGVKGEKRVEAEVVKLNGIEVERNIIREVVLSEPKPQVLKVGTKPIPAKYGTGVFGRPSYGTLTSRFGKRWGGNHTGIDLAGKTGDPIYASDGGKVIFAGWSGGYGKLVKIDHDNGYVTYYGHCSSILVKVGDRVAKGELIARVGSTGNSTGPHVHFEVRKNGVPQNPLNYIK